MAGGQWEGKAGAFGYQDGLDWVHVVEGSESNVVGLPMELLAEMLQAYGGITCATACLRCEGRVSLTAERGGMRKTSRSPFGSHSVWRQIAMRQGTADERLADMRCVGPTAQTETYFATMSLRFRNARTLTLL